ncbi:hypothetical protein SISNIDRAFT_456130, partial [Sistotremastrum niveocremeum HHB9708]
RMVLQAHFRKRNVGPPRNNPTGGVLWMLRLELDPQCQSWNREGVSCRICGEDTPIDNAHHNLRLDMWENHKLLCSE